jgi:glycine oxidase
MTKNLSVDYIIVGQGLAGSCVALQLLKSRKKIAVVDDLTKNNSSVIAAGLFNPITGKKTMVKTWLADILFPYLHEFYREAEALTGCRFFYPMSLYRPFQNAAEQNEWMGRSSDVSYQPFIHEVLTSSPFEQVLDPFGGLLLKHCGYVNTKAFLDGVKRLIIANAFYIHEHINYNEIIIESDLVSYRNVQAGGIIFCEGSRVGSNPWFNHVKVQPLKGETLTIKTEWNQQVILNRSVYMVPAEADYEFKIGATYNLKDTEQAITLEARNELEEKLKNLIAIPYEVVDQGWGIRPTTVDRRPVVGKHPKFDRFFIFNGLGTKGVSLAPYFSNVLVQSIENVIHPGKEVDVTRFKLLY